MTVDVRGTLSQITIGKYELTLTPLSDELISELDSFVRNRIIKTAWESSQELPPEVSDRLITLAIREAAVTSFSSEIGRKYVATPEGMARLLCLSAKKHHPDLTVKDIMEEMMNPDNIHKINASFTELNNPSGNGKVAAKKKKRQQLKKEKEKITSS